MTVKTSVQNAVKRSTEVSRPGAVSRGDRRGAGRPKGAKTRPRSLIPTELAEKILLTMHDQIPPEHFSYLKGVIKEGKAIATKQELDILILLLNRNVWAAMIMEGDLGKAEDGSSIGPLFRKDVTERLGILSKLLTLRHTLDRAEAANEDKDEVQPLVKIFGDRLGNDRLAILIQKDRPQEPQPMIIEGEARELPNE